MLPSSTVFYVKSNEPAFASCREPYLPGVSYGRGVAAGSQLIADDGMPRS